MMFLAGVVGFIVGGAAGAIVGFRYANMRACKMIDELFGGEGKPNIASETRRTTQ